LLHWRVIFLQWKEIGYEVMQACRNEQQDKHKSAPCDPVGSQGELAMVICPGSELSWT
jgi:hypothetical protein